MNGTRIRILRQRLPRAFNMYLKEDGHPDMLDARTKAAELQKPAVERYAKHGHRSLARFAE